MTNKTKRIKAYYPIPHFPPISLSSRCQLSCLHCQGHYLAGMTRLATPRDLDQFARTLLSRGGTGFLASGGFTTNGTLMNLETMLPTLAAIKKTTPLLIALHTGFVTPTLAHKLQRTGIDVACPHIIGDSDTIRDIMGLSAHPHNYAQTLENLAQANIPLSPHVCAGLYYGKLQGEQEAFQIIKDSCTPETLVITTLCPTRGTPLATSPPLSPAMLEIVIRRARSTLPQAELALGCMRPRARSLEITALTAGITRFANPSKSLLSFAQKKGYVITMYAACCGLPAALEQYTKKGHIP